MAMKLIDSGILVLTSGSEKLTIAANKPARTVRKLKYVVRQTVGIPLSSIGVTHSDATALADAPKMFDGEGDIIDMSGTDEQVDIRTVIFFTDAENMEVHYWMWDD